MGEKLQPKLTKNLLDIYQNELKELKKGGSGVRSGITRLEDDTGVHISSDGVSRLNELAYDVLNNRDKAADGYTVGDISEELQNILTSTYAEKPRNVNNIIQKKVREFLSSLAKSQINYRFLTTISNVELQINPLRIGDVRFLNTDSEDIDEIVASEVSAFSGNDCSKEDILGTPLRSSDGDVRPSCIAIVEKVSAFSENKAKVLALEKLENILNMLRLLSPRSVIGISGELDGSSEEAGIISADGDATTTREVKGKGVGRDLTLNKSITERKEFKCFQSLYSIDNPSNFQETIKNAVHWFGDSVKFEPSRDSYIKLVTALESIFRSNREPLTEKISERVALFMEDESDDRVEVYERLKRHIQKRNDLIHKGGAEFTQRELHEFMLLCRGPIIKACKCSESYESVESFLGSIDEKRFE